MNSPYIGKFKISQEFKGALVHDGLDLVGIDSKKIHCVVAGTVIFCGWENPNNHKQGFGQYVKVKTVNNDIWYYGHLSAISVKVGQIVKSKDVIGTEGNTGHSTGSHLHICCRPNGIKGNAKNVSVLLGIPNIKGIYNDNCDSKDDSIEDKINISYRVYSGGKWRNEIVNYNNDNSMGYAGVENQPIRGLAVKVDKGAIKYRVHKKGGNWLGWITAHNINDWTNGVAGSKNIEVDGIQLDFNGVTGYEAKYRVSTIGSDTYLPWVVDTSDYAGVFGKAIDKAQIEIAKK